MGCGLQIVILDTCFLIDLERNQADCRKFLVANESEELFTTVINLGELKAGYVGEWRIDFLKAYAHFRVLNVTEAEATRFAILYRELNSRGVTIGTNDLWIAAVALVHGMAVVTRNVQEFGRVPGLRVIMY